MHIFEGNSPPCTEARTRPPVIPNLKMPSAPARYGGLAASIVLHAVLVGLLATHGERLWSRTTSPGDPTLGGSRPAAGGGGGRVAYITLPALPRAESPPQFSVTVPNPPPKTIPTPAPEPVPVNQVRPEPAETSVIAVADTAGASADTGSGSGDGESPGTGVSGSTGDGAGPGNGTGTGGGGQGGTLRPPEPRDMAFPFDSPPKELRGVSLNVTFWVGADGRVERYQVRPEIKDRDYAKKFDEVMRAFRFTPARTPNGTRVAGTTSISFTLPGKSSS